MTDRRHPDEPIGMRPFERSLPMALLRAREASMRAFRPILAEHDLTEQQWRVLRALAETPEGLEVGDIATATFLLGPSLSRILANLEARGLIVRTPVPHDARRARISPTEGAVDLVRRVAPRSEDAYRHIESRFGADRLAELIDLLDDLAATTTYEDPEEQAS